MNLACKENLTLTGILSLTILSGLTLTLPSASADTDIVDDVSIEVPVACALTSTLDTDHTAEVNNGVYEPNIGKTTLKVTCNDSGGFSIYAIGFTGDTYTGEDHTKLIGANTNSKISTKVYASSDTASNWSIKLTPVSGSTISIENSFDNYHVVPDTSTKVATISSGTTPTTGASVETTYAAYMSGTQPADTYTGKVKYTLVHPSINDTNSFVVNFSANGGTGTMSSQKISRGVATALSANTFTAPSGFKFAGWNTKLDGSGTTYTKSASVTNLADAGESITLYAIWQEILPQSSCPSSPMLSTVVSGITYMQDINSTNSATVLSALTTDATYQIKDNRDNETYCVGKLADGKLWLLDNLALDLTNSAVLNGMNENNTHASNTTLGYLKGTTTRDPSTDANGPYATAGVTNWTSGHSFSAPLVNMDSKDLPTSGDTRISGVDTTSWKYGGYYNYCAASAGSYCYGNGTSASTSSGNATEDICPKGWRMPTGNTTGECQALYNNSSYNTYANYRSALRLPLSGFFESGSAKYQGALGGWWSSTRYDPYFMYTPSANTSDIYPASNKTRGSGSSVRCVLGS